MYARHDDRKVWPCRSSAITIKRAPLGHAGRTTLCSSLREVRVKVFSNLYENPAVAIDYMMLRMRRDGRERRPSRSASTPILLFGLPIEQTYECFAAAENAFLRSMYFNSDSAAFPGLSDSSAHISKDDLVTVDLF